MCAVLNACFYVNRTGCSWRYLPKEYPPWQTVYDYFTRWKRAGIWEEIHALLVAVLRIKSGRSNSPRLTMIDSQSVRAHYGENRGWDGFKKVRGRKRQILVDALGLVHGIRVHAANLEDRREGLTLTKIYFKKGIKPELMMADRAYNGCFSDYLTYYAGVKVQILSSSKKDPAATNLKPKRWIVERTFAWFNHYKRLARDYERTTLSSETMIRIAMMQLMLRRMAPR
jgi:putative transposase